MSNLYYRNLGEKLVCSKCGKDIIDEFIMIQDDARSIIIKIYHIDCC